MESSSTLHEAQEESGNLIQPHDHQIVKIDQQKNHEEETKEKVEEEIENITFMEYDVYKAAEKGEIKPAIEQRKDRLHSLLTPQKNTILHIYLTSKTSKDPEQDEFVEVILGFCPPLLMQVNAKEETPLHIAARYGHASIVKQLIEHAKQDHPHHHNQDHESRGAEAAKKMLRMASKEGDTALHEAVRFQHIDVVKILISEDGDFNHNANNSGETPLYMAVERGYNPIAEEIIEHCNSPATDGPTGRNALHAATIRKDKGSSDKWEWIIPLFVDISRNTRFLFSNKTLIREKAIAKSIPFAILGLTFCGILVIYGLGNGFEELLEEAKEELLEEAKAAKATLEEMDASRKLFLKPCI
ncbi:hypothetical protein FNV43_RR01530 [Rhamnella rubrinervis]|uniref:Uncharacterized protein n=1 Tax=Rhamnella rubrinervis TaxID=2594499 RepID=A0A8K0MS43_9ROSA|nr:hypothetical protein FNV43_RR01530 [Rhamnella rubrinervis]